MRVAFDAHVAGRRATGNETYAVNLAQALSRRSDVELVVYLDRGVPRLAAQPAIVRGLRTTTPFLRIPFELPIRARRDHAALLHVQYVGPPFPGVPLVTTIHDLSFEDVDGAFPRLTALRLKVSVSVTAKHSRAIVTGSDFTRSRIVERYGVDPARVFVTPFGVSRFWRPAPPDESNEMVKRLGLPRQSVLVVGKIHPRKNIPRLVRAVAAMRTAGIGDLHLMIVGQRGWRADDVDREITKLAGATWVHWLGHVTDEVLRDLYQAARVVAYVSTYEGFGLPVLEAIACGGVVLASAATSIPEVAGDAALLVDPTKDEAVTEGLRQLLTDEAMRAHLTAAGPRQAARFTWEACADRTVEAYRAAVGALGDKASRDR